MDGVSPNVMDLKHTKELGHDFNNDAFSLVYSVVDPDEIALAAREEIQGEPEFRLPSGPVSEAETPPVTVAGVNRSIHKGSWYQIMEKEMQGLIRVENIHSGGRVAPREDGCWVEMDAVLQV